MTAAEPPHAPAPDEELVPADDAVIGRAFRWSALVLVGLAAAVGVVLWQRGRSDAPPPSAAPPWRPPTTQEAATRAPDVPFRDVTRAAGISFVHEGGRSGEKLLPETMGAGAAFLDYDGDGDADLLLANGSRWPWEGVAPQDLPVRALYRNDGAGRFDDVTRAVGLADPHYGQGIAVGDADGDGDPDVFFTGVGGNRLYRNDGGRFTDVTAEAGVGGGPDEWTTSAGFFDADGDRDLDLFVCRYIQWSPDIDREVGYTLSGLGRAYGPPTNFRGAHPALYRNEGDGRFRDVSKEAGVEVVNEARGVPVAKALALSFLDVEGDGDLDVFVANDTTRNFLFLNDGRGRFDEAGVRAGVAYDAQGQATGAMGSDVADIRDDGCLSIAVGNFASEPTSLFQNRAGQVRFTDAATVEGIGAPSRRALKFGVLFLDYDLDGRVDLFQTNGHLEEDIAKVQPSQSYRQPSQLYWNLGGKEGGCYRLVPPGKAGDLDAPVVGRAAAYADVDGDGDLDLLVTQRADRPLLLRNDQALGHHWLRVRLAGRPPNTDAIGARVELRAGGRTQHRFHSLTRSYLSQVEGVLTFGLGLETAVESLVVTWPDGRRQEVAVPGVDRVLEVREAGD